MRGSYGLVLFVFGILVIIAEAIKRDFVPLRWMAVIHLVATFGAAWVGVAGLIRIASFPERDVANE